MNDPHHDVNYYEVLGVPRAATADDIAAAFRRLARRWHPDVCPDRHEAASQFKRAAEAFETLGDPDRRRQYNQSGAVKRPVASQQATSPARPVHQATVLELPVLPEEAMAGARIRFRLHLSRPCTVCHGAGWTRAGTPCARCRTVGYARVSYPLEVWLPAGTRDGAWLCVANATGALPGYEKLYLRVRIRPC